MAKNFSPVVRIRELDANGKPLSGGKLYTYRTDTSTPKTTYSDDSGTHNSNPVILDSEGYADVYLDRDEAYRFRLTTSAGVLRWERDNVTGNARTTAANVTFTHSGTGASAMTVNDALNLITTPEHFGAIGDGSTDDTSALQKAVDASLTVELGGGEKIYRITSPITLRTGQTILMRGAEIKQVTTNKEIFDIIGESDIFIGGGTLRGDGTYANTDSNNHRCALYGTGSEQNIRLYDCDLLSFGYAPIRALAATGVYMVNCRVVGPSSAITAGTNGGRCYGFLTDTGSKNVVVSNCDISGTGQGIRIEGSDDVVIDGCVIHGIVGQHGMYIGSNCRNIAIGNCVVDDVYWCGIKVQTNNLASYDNNGIAISGCTVRTFGDQGILVQNANGQTLQALRNRNVSITGCTVVATSTSGMGINVQNVENGVVADCTIEGANQSGIYVTGNKRLRVSDIRIINPLQHGITDAYANDGLTITNVDIVGCGSGYSGILLQADSGTGVAMNTDVLLSGIRVRDPSNVMSYGIYTPGVSNSELTVQNCDCSVGGGTSYGMRFRNSTDPLKRFSGNIFSGATAASYNNAPIPSVASAATITLPQGVRCVRITGTTNISAIRIPAQTDAVVTLIFDDVLTVVDGAGLSMAGNFVTTAADTLTLCCDGSGWYEIARSVN